MYSTSDSYRYSKCALFTYLLTYLLRHTYSVATSEYSHKHNNLVAKLGFQCTKINNHRTL